VAGEPYSSECVLMTNQSTRDTLVFQRVSSCGTLCRYGFRPAGEAGTLSPRTIGASASASLTQELTAMPR